MGLKWAIGGIYVEPSFRSCHSMPTLLQPEESFPRHLRLIPSCCHFRQTHAHARWQIYKLDLCCFHSPEHFSQPGSRKWFACLCGKKNTWKSQHFTLQRKCEKPTVQMFIQSRSPKRRRSRNTISSNFQPYLTCLLFSYSRLGRICLLCLESRRTKTR